MSQSHSDSILEVGIDYITTTALVRRTDTSLAAFGSFIVSEEANRGEPVRPWKFSGYRGLTTPHASFGTRPDSQIVKLSNEVATQYWAQAANLSTNITRLDVAVTARCGIGPTATLRKHHKELLRANKRQGRPITFKAWYGPKGCESLMVGSRASDQYLRCYDKYLESGLEKYRDCVRFEMELKRRVANFYAMQFDAAECSEPLMAQLVYTFATVRRLSLGWSPDSLLFDRVSTLQRWQSEHSISRTLSKRLAYATFCTQRLIQDCRAAGRLDDYISAVGLTDLVTSRVDQPKRSSGLVSEEVH